MRPLPRFRTTDFSLATVTVTRSGTISIRGVLYTVPSRLVGFAAEGAHLRRPAELLAGHDPGAGSAAPHRPRRGDEAGACRRLSPPGRRADQEAAGVPPLGVPRRAVPAPGVPAGLGGPGPGLEPRAACRVYVGLLHLAATHACEAALADHLEGVLACGELRRSRSPGWRWRRRRRSASSCRRRSGRLRPPVRPSAGRRSGMTDVDAARLPLMLATLHLPTIGRHWQSFARAPMPRAGGGRYLAALCEHELAERAQRRIARHLRESGLPAGKTFATFDFAAVPTVRKAHLLALAADSWIEQGANILCFGPSGTGKSHAAAAIGYALIEQGRRVLFTRPPTWCNGCRRRDGICRCPPDRQARPARLPGARRSRLRPQGSGRDRAVRTDRRALRAALADRHLQPAVQRLGADLPRSGDDRRRHRPAGAPRHHPRVQHRELSPTHRSRSRGADGG